MIINVEWPFAYALNKTLYPWNICQRSNRFETAREITKSSSTFSATNISSNIIWLPQLHDTIQMKSDHTWINYNRENIAIRSHIMIYDNVKNLIFGTKFSSFYLAKGEIHLLTCSVRKIVLMCLRQSIDMCLLYKSHQIARVVSHPLIIFSTKEFLECTKKMLLNLVPKMKFFTFFLHNCIMQLKQFYDIATKVTSKKVILLLVNYLTVKLCSEHESAM